MSAAIRPSFALDLECPSKVVLERLFARLGQGPHQLRRTRAFGSDRVADGRSQDHFILTVAEGEQRLWSPWLNVEVRPRGKGAYLFARFGPHPSVWTCFAFAYIGLTTVLLISLCAAAALKMSGGAPWTLHVSVASTAVMILMWWASQVGQRWGHEQMATLRGALEEAIAECGESRPSAEQPDE